MGNYVNDVDSSFWQTWGPSVPPAVYAAVGIADGNIIVDLRGMSRATFHIKNTGTDSMNWKILGSIDGGLEYDFVELTTTAVVHTPTPGTSEHQWSSWDDPGRIYTTVMIQMEKAVGIATVKVSAT